MLIGLLIGLIFIEGSTVLYSEKIELFLIIILTTRVDTTMSNNSLNADPETINFWQERARCYENELISFTRSRNFIAMWLHYTMKVLDRVKASLKAKYEKAGNTGFDRKFSKMLGKKVIYSVEYAKQAIALLSDEDVAKCLSLCQSADVSEFQNLSDGLSYVEFTDNFVDTFEELCGVLHAFGKKHAVEFNCDDCIDENVEDWCFAIKKMVIKYNTFIKKIALYEPGLNESIEKLTELGVPFERKQCVIQVEEKVEEDQFDIVRKQLCDAMNPSIYPEGVFTNGDFSCEMAQLLYQVTMSWTGGAELSISEGHQLNMLLDDYLAFGTAIDDSEKKECRQVTEQCNYVVDLFNQAVDLFKGENVCEKIKLNLWFEEE